MICSPHLKSLDMWSISLEWRERVYKPACSFFKTLRGERKDRTVKGLILFLWEVKLCLKPDLQTEKTVSNCTKAAKETTEVSICYSLPKASRLVPHLFSDWCYSEQEYEQKKLLRSSVLTHFFSTSLFSHHLQYWLFYFFPNPSAKLKRK